jgi:predicted nucleic acid-binding protein
MSARGPVPEIFERLARPDGPLSARGARELAQLSTDETAEAAKARARKAAQEPETIEKLIEQVMEKLREGLAKDIAQVMTVFRRWDSDKSGYVDKKEFHGACTKGLGIEATKEAIDATFDSFDVGQCSHLSPRLVRLPPAVHVPSVLTPPCPSLLRPVLIRGRR